MDRSHDAPSDDGKGKQTSRKRSVFLLFIIGSLMVTLPVILILNWNSSACGVAIQDFCRGSQLYKTSVAILPYVMLAGGAIVGYNMKRVYDFASLGRNGDEGEIEYEDEDDGKSPSYDDLR